MNGPFQTGHQAPRGWLWSARVVTILLGLVSLAFILLFLPNFLRGAAGHWHQLATIIGLFVWLLTFLAGIFPYGLVAWNLTKEKDLAKGSIQALIIGGFWFFFGYILPTDLAFHGLTADFSDSPYVIVGIVFFFMVPGLLLLVSALNLVASPEISAQVASGAAGRQPNLTAQRGTLAAASILLGFPAVLCAFTLRSSSNLQFVMIEALLLLGILPYGFILRALCDPRRKHAGWAMARGIAIGFLSLLLLGGAFYGFIVARTPSSRPHHVSTWAELAFFALLGLANLGILLTGFRLERSPAGARTKHFPFAPTATIPLCLAAYWFVMFLISAAY